MAEGSMGRLESKAAIVTGGAHGIGRAYCLGLAKESAKIAVVDLDLEAAEEVARTIGEQGGEAVAIYADVSSEASTIAMAANAAEALGSVDILVNNAAFARGADRVPVADLTPDLFNLVMDIKVGGTFYCTKAFMEQITKQGEGGKIVNISSSAGKRGSSNTLAYNAANFAVVGMTQSMAREFGPMGVNVNCVCPGAVDTHRMDDLGRGDTWTNMAANTPIGRNGTDEEIGDFIAYLCTEAASWIQGQSINLNGGTIMEH